MKPAQLVLVVAVALLLVVPATAGAQESQSLTDEEQAPRRAKVKTSAWLIGIRFGGFTDNDHAVRYHSHAKSAYYYSPEPEVTGALDISYLFSPRSGMTLSLEGMAFAGDAVAMAPITMTYKYFILGNGLDPNPRRRAPAVQPWVGFGGGMYTFVLDDRDIVRSRIGAQLSSGLLIPLGRHFDVVGELRYAMSSDTRILSYTMGFGLRF